MTRVSGQRLDNCVSKVGLHEGTDDLTGRRKEGMISVCPDDGRSERLRRPQLKR